MEEAGKPVSFWDHIQARTKGALPMTLDYQNHGKMARHLCFSLPHQGGSSTMSIILVMRGPVFATGVAHRRQVTFPVNGQQGGFALFPLSRPNRKG